MNAGPLTRVDDCAVEFQKGKGLGVLVHHTEPVFSSVLPDDCFVFSPLVSDKRNCGSGGDSKVRRSMRQQAICGLI